MLVCISAWGSARVAPFSSPAKHPKPVPGDAGTNYRQINAMAENSAFSPLWDVIPHPTPWPPAGAHSRVTLLYLLLTHTNDLQSGSGSCQVRDPPSQPRSSLSIGPTVSPRTHAPSPCYLSTPPASDQLQASAQGHVQHPPPLLPLQRSKS